MIFKLKKWRRELVKMKEMLLPRSMLRKWSFKLLRTIN
jgi:hypothetical protein